MKELRMKAFIVSLACMIIIMILMSIIRRNDRIIIEEVPVFYLDTKPEVGSYNAEIDGVIQLEVH